MDAGEAIGLIEDTEPMVVADDEQSRFRHRRLE
jgi:hypothetical protein